MQSPYRVFCLSVAACLDQTFGSYFVDPGHKKWKVVDVLNAIAVSYRYIEIVTDLRNLPKRKGVLMTKLGSC